MSPADLSAVVKLAAQRGIWVLSDECYVYLNYTGQQFSVGSLNEYREHMVILGSLSKTYAMTGWRLGYALALSIVGPVIGELSHGHLSRYTWVKILCVLLTGITANVLGPAPPLLFIAVLFGVTAQFLLMLLVGQASAFMNALRRVTNLGATAYIIFIILPLFR